MTYHKLNFSTMYQSYMASQQQSKEQTSTTMAGGSHPPPTTTTTGNSHPPPTATTTMWGGGNPPTTTTTTNPLYSKSISIDPSLGTSPTNAMYKLGSKSQVGAVDFGSKVVSPVEQAPAVTEAWCAAFPGYYYHRKSPVQLGVKGQQYTKSMPLLSVQGGPALSAMEKYENLGLVGEGSYGMVLKCKHKETGQHVAIKKFLESEDDKMVKKIAMREVKMLKQLRHENLVNLIEVFRRKKRLYLVFEFVDHTVLDDLERCPNGLDDTTVRKVLWQVLKGIEFCHLHNIIHRDIKPENILVSKNGVVKLCDFGFARTLAQPGEAYTDYVATRWYRAPELLVGDTKYGRAVDIWAVGCLTAEMLTGEPLFPGDSDIDQLYHIVKTFGNLSARQREIFHKNPLFVGMRLPEVREVEPLEKKFPRISPIILDLMKQCLRLDANDRPTCSQLLRHEFFTRDNFAQKFPQEIRSKMVKETEGNPLLKSKSRDEGADKDSKDKENGKKKKKEHKYDKIDKPKDPIKDNKSDNTIEDKPKRKLPDPDKLKKPSPPLTTGQQPSQAGKPHQSGGEDVPPPSGSPTSSMPPIQGNQASVTSHFHHNIHLQNQLNSSSYPFMGSPTFGNLLSSHNYRVSDKTKKGVLAVGGPPGFMKGSKGGQAPSHSQTLSLQTEKTLHDKSQFYDKMKGSKKSKDAILQDPAAGRKGQESLPSLLSLPEVKGAEANPNKASKMNKKSQFSTIPHITNLDPFSDNQNGSPTPSDRDSNLPLV